MILESYKHEQLTHTIIGCAMEVHKTLGNGFQEVVYQKALAVELRLQNISFAREVEMPLFYKNTDIGTRRGRFFYRKQGVSRTKSNHTVRRGSSGTGP